MISYCHRHDLEISPCPLCPKGEAIKAPLCGHCSQNAIVLITGPNGYTSYRCSGCRPLRLGYGAYENHKEVSV